MVDVVAEIRAARSALLQVWPRGENCEHTRAQEAFRALDRAEAAATLLNGELALRQFNLERIWKACDLDDPPPTSVNAVTDTVIAHIGNLDDANRDHL